MKQLHKLEEPKKEVKSVWQKTEKESLETQQIITQKMRDGLNRQKQFRKTFFMRLYTEQEIDEIKSQLDSGNIKMQWYGQVMPKDILKSELMMKYCIYQDYVAQENYLKQTLIKDGLTGQEINDVLNFKFNKTEQNVEIANIKLDKLQQLEKEKEEVIPDEKVEIENGIDKDLIE
jgi:soluble cytochrome b562